MSAWRGLAAEVVATRYPSLVAYGVLLTANRADSEDLVQDALVKVFSRIRNLPNAAAADQYVRRAMLTIYLDGVRRDTLWRRIRGAVASDDAIAGPEHLVARRARTCALRSRRSTRASGRASSFATLTT